MTEANAQHPNNRQGIIILIVSLLVAIVILVIAGGTGWWLISSSSGHGLTGFVTRTRQQHKYVVTTAFVTVIVTDKSSEADWWEIMKTKISSTTLRVKVSECKVQYYVPLDGLKTSDVIDDPGNKRMSVTIPYPVLDENMVSVPADPSHWNYQMEGGWLRWDKGDIEARIRKGLEREVLETAKKQGLERGDELAAQESVEKLLSDIFRSQTGQERTVKVEFRR